MDKIKKRDFKKEQPEEYQVCLILPQFVRAEYQDGFFIGNHDSVMYIGVKYWIPIREVTEMFTY